MTRRELEMLFSKLDSIRLGIRGVEQNIEPKQEINHVKSSEEIWKEKESNPSTITAETFYEVQSYQGTSLTVLFSQKIVDEIFNHHDPTMIRSSIKAVSQIKRGIFGARYSGPGIKHLKVNSKVLELGAYGKDAGRLRFGGYLHDGVLHFVHWSNQGEHHSASYITKFRDAVLAAKQRRGH